MLIKNTMITAAFISLISVSSYAACPQNAVDGLNNCDEKNQIVIKSLNAIIQSSDNLTASNVKEAKKARVAGKQIILS